MDIDGDGIPDILSGSYSRMDKDMAGLFQVLSGRKDGTFQKAKVLTGTDGEPLIIPAKGDEKLTDKICTRPFAVDWDGDGHLDLVVGNFAGTFFWFKGEGKGKFAPKAEPILAGGGEPLKVPGVHSDPFVIDFDGDGRLDIVSGCSDGGVYWARNIAGKGEKPVFKGFEPLIPPGSAAHYGSTLREDEVKRPNYAARVWVADINGDGKLDLLVGDSVTLVEPAKGLTEAEMKAKQSAWQGAMQAAQEAYSRADGEAAKTKAHQELSNLSQQRSEFMREDMTGFVWVYLQK